MKLFYRLTLTLIVFFTAFTLQAQVKKKVATKPAITKTQKKIATKKVIIKPIKTVSEKSGEVRVRITTDLGEIIVRLSDKTPLHRDNFIKVVKDHFYDSLLFHRVIPDFMIQGGDPSSKNAVPGIMLGGGDIGYTVPAEFDTTLYHKKGALAAARNNNPEKASSGCQFYLVQGKKHTDEELNSIEKSNNIKFSSARRMTYKMLGGTPRLDMNYTVFGEVESGLDIIEQITLLPRDNMNRPFTDMRMRMELIPEIKKVINK